MTVDISVMVLVLSCSMNLYVYSYFIEFSYDNLVKKCYCYQTMLPTMLHTFLFTEKYELHAIQFSIY